ncbi:MAG: hypothetical protein HY899_16285 [Deltaproteobacteria bacterium]|nr:hypothetical protein [Deltaproteobacteria bacterium]
MPFPGGIVIAALASGLFLFFLPGMLLVRASGAKLPRAELPAWAFAGSAAVLFVCFAGVAALGLPLNAALWPLGAVVVIAAAAGRRGARLGDAQAIAGATQEEPRRDAEVFARATQETRAGSVAPAARGQDAANVPPLVCAQSAPRWWKPLLLVVVVAAAVAAAIFASVGSIDRWWYLAYVRSYLEGDALRITEPFLGTERVFARFGVHPWLMGLALWSKLSGADPVWLYERVAPVFAIAAAASATIALARALFGHGALARAAVVATLLSWSGGLLPVLARAGEDKVLAQAALASLCLAACLNAVRGERGALVMAALAAGATATLHGLVFAFVLAVWLPLALLRAVTAASERRAVAATTLLLMVVAVQPAAMGLMVERSLVEAGAVARSADHPVLRVHDSRDRTIDAGSLGFVVHPRLLAHPLSLLALGALPLLLRRRRSLACDFLLASTATALLIAFVPPLPALAAKIIPAWMVYRVLWVLPLGALAALGAAEVAKWLGGGEVATLALLFALGAFPLATSIQQRAGEVRARRAVPSTAEFCAAVEAVAALPAGALVAAAPQLAERLPALTGRRMVATLDRSTIMFSGSRDAGEARLLLRAATLAGDTRAAALATQLAVHPTHALFDPRAGALPLCGQRLLSGAEYALCALAEPTAETETLSLRRIEEMPGGALLPERGGGGAATSGSARDGGSDDAPCATSCTPPARGELVAVSQPGDWDAAPPLVDCRIRCRTEVGATAVSIRAVEILPLVGRAVDELLLRARGLRQGREIYVATGRARTDGSAPLRFALPAAETAAIDTVELRIASGLLPFVKLRGVRWSAGDARVP